MNSSSYNTTQLSQKLQETNAGLVFHHIYDVFLDPKNQENAKKILAVFMERFIHPAQPDVSKKDRQTILDLIYCPEILEDTEKKILNALLGYNETLMNEEYLERDGLVKLNYILNESKKLFETLEKNNAKKIFLQDFQTWQTLGSFSINSLDDYQSILKYISDLKNPDGSPKSRLQLSVHCTFMKMVYIFSHLNSFDIIKEQEKIFKILGTELFQDFFPTSEIHIKEQGKGYGSSQYFEYDSNPKLPDGDIKVTLKGRTKSIQSTFEKMGRDPEYGDLESFKDLFGFQIEVPTLGQLIELLDHFMQRVEQHPLYQTASTTKGLKSHIGIKNKGMFKTLKPHFGKILEEYFGDIHIKSQGSLLTQINIPPMCDKELFEVIQTSIENIHNSELKKTLTNEFYKDNNPTLNEKRKQNCNEDYKDIKLTIPLIVKGSITHIEVKFVLQNNDNEQGFASHAIVELKRLLELRSRETRGLNYQYIMVMINETLEKNQSLVHFLGSGNKNLARTKIFDHLLESGNIIEKQIPNLNFKSLESVVRNLSKDMEQRGLLNTGENQDLEDLLNVFLQTILDSKNENIDIQLGKKIVVDELFEIYKFFMKPGSSPDYLVKDYLSHHFDALTSYYISSSIEGRFADDSEENGIDFLQN